MSAAYGKGVLHLRKERPQHFGLQVVQPVRVLRIAGTVVPRFYDARQSLSVRGLQVWKITPFVPVLQRGATDNQEVAAPKYLHVLRAKAHGLSVSRTHPQQRPIYVKENTGNSAPQGKAGQGAELVNSLYC